MPRRNGSRLELAPDLPAWAENGKPLADPETMPAPPKGCVWVEWVGEISPLHNPVIQYKLITGQLPAEDAEILRSIARLRVARVEGISWRGLHAGNGSGEIPHFTEPVVVWGPDRNAKPGAIGSYIQALTHADADKVKSSDVGHQFRIWWEKDGGGAVQFTFPEQTITLGKEQFFRTTPEFHRAMGWSAAARHAAE